MKLKTLRTLVPLAVLVVVGIGFAGHGGIGDLSALGWRDIALICPVGALTVMLATKMMIPRALVSLVIVAVLVVVFGRAFCGWVCPVPVVARLRELFASQKKSASGHGSAPVATDAASASEAAKVRPAALTDEERRLLAGGCGACAERHGTIDARHVVLGGSLLSAAIFGFPVFCLVCPVGLSFATVFLLMRAFGFGDVSWTLVVVPIFLILEVTVFRKWCHTFCPISAFMSLVGLANRTFRPSIDDSTCLETAHGHECGRCGLVCTEGIDPRHPQLGNGMNECTRCRACVEACPSGALSIPFLPKKDAKDGPQPVVLQATEDRVSGD